MPVSAFISALAIITVTLERITVIVSGGIDMITEFVDLTVNETPATVTAISADRAVATRCQSTSMIGTATPSRFAAPCVMTTMDEAMCYPAVDSFIAS